MYDWSWKIEHLLTDMIDEVEKKYGNEAEIYVMDFDSNEFNCDLNYDDGDEFCAEKLDRIYIEYKGETEWIEKISGMYEIDGFIPVSHIEVLSGAMAIVCKYLNKIEKVLKEEGYHEQG